MSTPKRSACFEQGARENVFLDVVRRTLPFMPPHIATMVEFQYLTGIRPCELCRMTVGSIKRHAYSDGWYCDLGIRKDGKFVKKTYIPLYDSAYELLAPYLEGKKPEDTIFTPWLSWKLHDYTTYSDFYSSRSYKESIRRAICKGNEVLPEDQRIPHWTPVLIEMLASGGSITVGGKEENQSEWDLKFVES